MIEPRRLTPEGNPICPKCEHSFYTEQILNFHYAKTHCVKLYTISGPNKTYRILFFETQEAVDFYNKTLGKRIPGPGYYFVRWVDQPSCCNGYTEIIPIQELLHELNQTIADAQETKRAVENFIEDVTNV